MSFLSKFTHSARVDRRSRSPSRPLQVEHLEQRCLLAELLVSTSHELQEALASANEGDIVRLAPGIYRPVLEATAGNARSSSFAIGANSISLVGDSPLNTILSGDLGVLSVAADNAYHVVTVESRSNITFQNLSIVDGFADLLEETATDSVSNKGGGVYAHSSSLTLVNVAFRNNVARLQGGAVNAESTSLAIRQGSFVSNSTSNLGQGGQEGSAVNSSRGGAIFQRLGSLSIEDSIFRENAAVDRFAHAGAIRFFGTGEGAGPLSITNTLFRDNSAGQYGGALSIDGVATLSNTTFIGNHTTHRSGGALGLIAGSLEIRNSSFENNTAGSSGGAISQSGGRMNISGTAFVGNTANTGGCALLIRYDVLGLQWGEVEVVANVSNSTFTGNTAQGNSGSTGVNSTAGGAILNAARATLRVANSTFAGNSAISGDGGAIANGSVNNIDNSSPQNFQSALLPGTITGDDRLVVFASRFENNQALAGNGGAIATDGASLTTISTSVFKENRALIGVDAHPPVAGFNSKRGLGGAVSTDTYSESNISYSTFTQNHAESGGGAIWVGIDGTIPPEAIAALLDATFPLVYSRLLKAMELRGDTSDPRDPASPYNIFVSRLYSTLTPTESRLTVSQCSFVSNTSQRQGGAVDVESGGVAAIVGSSFRLNRADTGNALHLAVDAVFEGLGNLFAWGQDVKRSSS